MKLVKKILRLMPFLMYLIIFLSFMFTVKFNIASDGIWNYSTTTEFFNNLWRYFEENYTRLLSLNGTTFNTLFNKINQVFGVNFQGVLRISAATLVYELWLSVVFLMFDVFNFILGVANKWLKKGGNLDE